MAGVVVDLCVDVGSPYSWFCLEVLLRYKNRWGLKLNVRPVLLGAILQATTNVMPSLVPARGKWLTEDMERNARFMSVPFKGAPTNFGSPFFNTIQCQRFLTAVAVSKGYDSQEVVNLFLALYESIWGVQPPNDVDVRDPALIKKCCEIAGLSVDDTAAYLKQSRDEIAKQTLKENSDIAVAKGAFGTPTMFVYLNDLDGSQWKLKEQDLMIFGSDRFEQLAFAIGKKWDGPCPLWSRI